MDDNLFYKELFIRLLLESFVNALLYVCVSFPFGFEGWMLDVFVLIPDHCLSIYFDLEKVGDPDVECTYPATIRRKFATGLKDKDRDINTMNTAYNTTQTDAAKERLGKERHKKRAVGHRRRCSRHL